jgi:prostaglandin-H2 D-isomerase / glutathione transferase
MTSQPVIRLYYFDFPFWRAETSRLALHLGGIPFEDVRLGRDAFREMKSAGRFPFGQVPVLEVDGRMLAQSGAIARYCGELAGLYPADRFQAAKVDEAFGAASDITGWVGRSMRVSDPEEKAALRAELAGEVLPHWLGLLERLLSDNGTGFFVSEELTVADLAIWRLMGWLSGGVLDGIPTGIMETFPLLKEHHQRIGGIEKVRGWMESHGSQ